MLARPIALAVCAVAILGGVVAVLGRLADPGLVGTATAVVACTVAVLAVIRLLVRVWEWDRTMLVVTREHLVVRRGGLRRCEQIVPLAGIARLVIRRTVCGRVCGYATLELHGHGHRSRLRFVPRPDAVCGLISAYAGRRGDAVS